MKIIICNDCGKRDIQGCKEISQIYGDLCCNCCRKRGLQTESCKLENQEFMLLVKGKELNENESKGIRLERALSKTLKMLEIPHKSNPFGLLYSSYQVTNPDIIIDELDAIIECKNLSEKQVNQIISKKWLDKHVINRPNTSQHSLKMALFSYKPPKSLVEYLREHNWKAYGLGFQILSGKQEKKAIPRLKQQFWWLKKKYQHMSKSNKLQN